MGVERTGDREIWLVTQAHDFAIPAHPHQWVDAHAALDLSEPLQALRFTHDGLAVGGQDLAFVLDTVLVFDGFDRVPAVEHVPVAGMVGGVRVTTVQPLFARAPTQMSFA